MLTLRELRRVTAVLGERLQDARLERIVQPDATSLVLVFHVRGGPKLPLLLSCASRTARLALLDASPKAPVKPPAFAEYLRAHALRSRLESARILDDDRQALLRLEGREGVHQILLSILGPRSNVYVLDGEGILRASLRPVARSRRDLAVGEPWRSPASGAPREGEDRFADVPDADLPAAIETHYAEAEREGEVESLGRRLRQAFRKQAQAHARKRRKIAEDLADGERADAYRRQGEALKGALGRVKAGMQTLTAWDYETGEDVTIELDPALQPRENLERLFRRYQKALKRAVRAGQESASLDDHEREVADLEAELESLVAGGDGAALEALAGRAPVARLLKRFSPPPVTETSAPKPQGHKSWEGLAGRLRPRCYRSSDGLEIWVGRSDEGNDHLTRRLARGHDLFFHLEAEPGSHVILRTEGRSDPPSESLLEAAELAVHFSKQKASTRASVHVVPIKNVRKPKGAKPGLVYVTGGRYLDLRRKPARLERVLAAREDGDH